MERSLIRSHQEFTDQLIDMIGSFSLSHGDIYIDNIQINNHQMLDGRFIFDNVNVRICVQPNWPRIFLMEGDKGTKEDKQS